MSRGVSHGPTRAKVNDARRNPTESAMHAKISFGLVGLWDSGFFMQNYFSTILYTQIYLSMTRYDKKMRNARPYLHYLLNPSQKHTTRTRAARFVSARSPNVRVDALDLSRSTAFMKYRGKMHEIAPLHVFYSRTQYIVSLSGLFVHVILLTLFLAVSLAHSSSTYHHHPL